MDPDLDEDSGTPPATEVSLRDTLSQAYDSSHAPEGAGGEAVTPATAPHSLAKQNGDAEQSPVVKSDVAAQPPSATQSSEPVPYERAIPERLKTKLGEKWTTIPSEIRDEFHAYETHIGQMANKYGKAAKAWEETQQAFAPYEQMVRAEGGNFHGAMTNLFETARILRQGSPEQKVALIKQISSTFNIPIDTATGEQAGSAPAAVSPELIDRLNRLEQGILTREATEVHNARAKVESDLQTFLADPRHVYVQEPGYLDTMAGLITAGKATGLDDAYTQAAWLHEGPRNAEIAKINAAKLTPRIEQAAHARKVGVSVNGNAPGTVKLDPSKLSLRDTLSAAFDGELN